MISRKIIFRNGRNSNWRSRFCTERRSRALSLYSAEATCCGKLLEAEFKILINWHAQYLLLRFTFCIQFTLLLLGHHAYHLFFVFLKPSSLLQTHWLFANGMQMPGIMRSDETQRAPFKKGLDEETASTLFKFDLTSLHQILIVVGVVPLLLYTAIATYQGEEAPATTGFWQQFRRFGIYGTFGDRLNIFSCRGMSSHIVFYDKLP